MKEELRQFIHSDRRDFVSDPLDELHVQSDPVLQFAHWFEDAVRQKLTDPYAFLLATACSDGFPAARVMYMRDFTQRGLTFFTNYESEKGRHLAENPRASCVFFWSELHRQVRLSGPVEKVSPKESDEYFMSRPRQSRIGAWASAQSSVIDGRQVLDARMAQYTQQFEGAEVTRPPHWGGFIVKPVRIEFWQGRESRLHDRLLFERQGDGPWRMVRLSP
jgi:pyridoxamine 5'-phosphate oxidase